jgi:hypothetical protein
VRLYFESSVNAILPDFYFTAIPKRGITILEPAVRVIRTQVLSQHPNIGHCSHGVDALGLVPKPKRWANDPPAKAGSKHSGTRHGGRTYPGALAHLARALS